ncbi:c-type cytochrome [Cupriavidus necator]|uniref:c-type cytochrome n=1 Tax=Cupriavidus necator TaxID=106590 RepID=UPI00339D50F2
MKMKRMMFATAAVAAAAAAFLVPDLLDYHRFSTALDRQAQASQASGPWPQFAETCFACHGPHGQSRNAEYPALAGQPAAYLEAQLRAFANGQRDNLTMGPLARNLTDEQIRSLAAYYARQAPAGSPDAMENAALEARGKAVVQARSCQACHGEALTGKELAPRLAGQAEHYIAHQLAAFKSGERHDASGAMDGIAATLSNEDIPAVARYLARMSPDPRQIGARQDPAGQQR